MYANLEKFLPECEVVLLDYSNLEEWLGIDVYDEILFKDFSLPRLQAMYEKTTAAETDWRTVPQNWKRYDPFRTGQTRGKSISQRK